MPINDLYRPTILLQMMCKGWEERRRVGAKEYVIFSHNFHKSANSKSAKDTLIVCPSRAYTGVILNKTGSNTKYLKLRPRFRFPTDIMKKIL